ncbi:Crp/Fnr family transcriptional regulator [soil metagenome]
MSQMSSCYAKIDSGSGRSVLPQLRNIFLLQLIKWRMQLESQNEKIIMKKLKMPKKVSISPDDPKKNGILAALPKAEFARLLPELEFIAMPLNWTISESGDHVRYLHFPTSGIVSLIYALENGSSSEVALVGNEGMVGISIFMGGDSMPTSTEVQSAGGAYRLSRKFMKEEFALDGQLQHLALLYTQALICQTSQTAVCNQHHSLDQQLCRWLLMSLDRLESDELVITQQVIAKLLGVRRESISQTTSVLQKDGLIECSRGRIKVVNRSHIEKRVCECYAVVKQEYDRLLPPC